MKYHKWCKMIHTYLVQDVLEIFILQYTFCRHCLVVLSSTTNNVMKWSHSSYWPPKVIATMFLNNIVTQWPMLNTFTITYIFVILRTKSYNVMIIFSKTIYNFKFMSLLYSLQIIVISTTMVAKIQVSSDFFQNSTI